MRLCFLIEVFLFFNLVFAQESLITSKIEEVKGFTMTVVDKGGRKKASISGSAGNILPNGVIEVIDVVARIYGDSKSGGDTLIHTSNGFYDRIKNVVTTDQFVRINRKNMVITGIGLVWNPDDCRIEIKGNVKVEYLSGSPTVTDSPSDNRSTIITSRGSGVVDYQKDIVVFKKDVMIQDPDAILRAHRMKVFFNDITQKITMVEAYGNVRIKQPKRESQSRKAVYYVEEGRIVLTGYPRIMQGLDFYTADKVTIFDKGNRVVFEPKARLVIYASTKHEEM